MRSFRRRPLTRLILAVGGGYATTSLIAMMLAGVFPPPASEAVPGGALVGLALYPVLIICGFMVKELRHLLGGIAFIAILLGLIVMGCLQS